jgi:hypothetical protein
LLVNLADLLNGRFQLLIVGQTTLYMSDLIFTETDLADARAGIADGENRYGMSFAAIALGTARAMPDDSLEQGAAEDVLGAGEARGEAIAFTKSGYMIHY